MSLKIWLPLNGNIENQGTLNTTSRLPSGYTEVEYLESTGTQYIDTGVDNNTNSIKLYTTIQVTVPASASAYALGYYTNNQGQFFLYRSGTVWQWAWRCSYLNSTGVFDTNKHSHIFYVENNIAYYKLDGQIVSQHSTDRAGGRIYIAGNKHNQSTVRTFTAAIDDGNTVKRNFVPCYRNSDNKPGMYDTMTGTFYTNAGSGEFSVGPAVTCSITNNGATVDNNGKIGKCYSFNGGTITAPAPKITNKITVAAWIKAPDNNSGWRRVCGMQSAAISWQSASALLMLNGTNLYFSISNGSTCTSGGCVFNIGDSSNWFHACGTYDGTTARLYVNGILKKECAIATTIENTPIWLGGTSAGERFTGKLNDFRLYDECLSVDQIKEISRGMVLHYKMCGNVQTPNNCYAYPTFDISATNGGWGHWTASGGSGSFSQNTDKNFIFRSGQTYSHKVVCDSSATYDYLCYQEPAFSGGYRSMCAIIKASDGVKITENICYPTWNSRNGGVENNKWTSVNKLRDGFYLCKCEGIKQDGSNDLVGIYVKPGKTIYISECYLENYYERCSDFWTRTDIEYDGSGFKNHGTVSGNVTLSADSPRYTGSYKFIPNAMISTPGIVNFDKCTYSVWCKDPNMSYKIVFCDGTSKVAFGESSGFLCSCGSNSQNKFTKNNWKNSDWNHVVVVRDGSTYKMYINGEAETQYGAADYWNHSASTITVGGREENAAMWNGNISDFRIYATALDATDVAELYKLGR